MAEVYGLYRDSDPTIRYIGMTSNNTKRRFAQHLRSSQNGSNLPVYNWLRKYNDITYIVLHSNISPDQAFELEKLEIATRKNLLNCTVGGEGTIGFSHSAESRAKMSLARKGKKHTAEHSRKIAEAKKGTTVSAAVRIKMSNAAKGRTVSLETRSKIAKAQANIQLVTCPHCAKTIKPNVAGRWHFDKCKSIT